MPDRAPDEIATTFCQRMTMIHKKGNETLHEQHRAESKRLLDVVGDVLTNAASLARP